MNTLTLEVTSLADGLAAFQSAWSSGGADDGARIGFASPELLWKVLTAKRWELLRTMTGQGPLALREIARRVERDVKAVHADVHALIDAGIIQRGADGRFEFPYDAVHVDFMLKAA
ncbi:DNA-binding protein [Azospirillum sp. YIM B02556]|uniref:DNA-binding protein n=1 Tax=Azospirillum endophyticum TaxID=2800326 RepID=A0ABS1F1Z1_9PROT|nr:DNA-binding protein [Azospirillum endophyticum]MBK1837394.1 DNA-binding protein [Azospirillum endophyticum]